MQKNIHQATLWTSKIKLQRLVWDTLITPMSEGIQSKSKLCPTKMVPLISSPIKSISCPRDYFSLFISPVVFGNSVLSGLHLPGLGPLCSMSTALYYSLMPPTASNHAHWLHPPHCEAFQYAPQLLPLCQGWPEPNAPRCSWNGSTSDSFP